MTTAGGPETRPGDGSAREAASSEYTYRRAVGWSFVLTAGQEAMTFLVTLVLAGLLGPEAYGIVALAAVYLLLLQMCLQAMIPAVVQRPQLSDSDKDTAFWMTLGASLVFVAISLALSGWWAGVNGVPELQPVVVAMSALVVIRGLVVVQEALLRRAMNFAPLALRTNVSVAAGAVVGIVLALRGAGAWALVGQQLTTGVVELIVLWGITEWRPRFRFRYDAAKELARFSGASALGTLGVFVNNRADVLLMGLFFGAAAVGLYRLASRIVESVANLLTVSLQSVALPELARHQNDQHMFALRLVTVVRTSAMLALPTLGVLVACSTPLIELLGAEWGPATRVLEILCIVGASRVVVSFTGPMLQAQGRPGLGAALAWAAGILSALTFTLTGVLLEGSDVVDQVLWMAISRAFLFGVVYLWVNLWLMRRFGRTPVRTTVRAVLPSLGAAISAIAAGWLFRGAGLTDGWPVIAVLAATAIVTGTVALAVLGAIEPHARSLGTDLRRTIAGRMSATNRHQTPDHEPVEAGRSDSTGEGR